MRLLHAVPSWLPLTQAWLHDLVRFLPVRGRVVCRHAVGPDRFPWPDLDVLPPASRWQRLLGRTDAEARFGAFARRVARRHRATVLHSHFGPTAWQVRRAAEGRAHFVSFYGQDLTRFPRVDPAWTDRYREVLAEAAGVLCEGPHMQSVVRSLQPKARTVVHGLGVDLPAIPFRPRGKRPGEPLRVLMAGTFREKKGIPDALAALALLRDAGVPFEATLVGDAGPDPAEQREKARVRQVLADPRLAACQAVGYVSLDRLRALAASHHVFLSPSVTAADGDTEGGAPVTVIEMAASGMPVVATRHCDVPNVLAPESAPLLAAERDPAGLAERLRWLDGNPDAWGAIAAANRRHAERHHDARRQAERLARVYGGEA